MSREVRLSYCRFQYRYNFEYFPGSAKVCVVEYVVEKISDAFDGWNWGHFQDKV